MLNCNFQRNQQIRLIDRLIKVVTVVGGKAHRQNCLYKQLNRQRIRELHSLISCTVANTTNILYALVVLFNESSPEVHPTQNTILQLARIAMMGLAVPGFLPQSKKMQEL